MTGTLDNLQPLGDAADPATGRRSAIALLQQGRFSDAEQLLSELTTRTPHDKDVHNNLGVAILNQERAPESETAFRRAIALDPTFFEAHVNLGNALNAQGFFEKAADSYRDALALRDNSAVVRNNLATALHASGRIEEAIEQYRAGLAFHATDASASVNLAKALVSVGRQSEAVDVLVSAVSFAPTAPDVHRELGELLIAMGRPSEAIDSFYWLTRLEPERPGNHVRLGQIQNLSGQPDVAGQSFRRAIELDPNNGDAHFGLGLLAEAEGDSHQAYRHFSTVIASHPGHAISHLNLGGIAFRQGRIEDAMRHNNAAIAADPALPQAHNNLGNCHYVSRRYVAAIESYGRALALQPSLPNAIGLHQLAKRQICDWTDLRQSEAALLQLARAGDGVIDPFSLLWVTDDPTLQLAAARGFVQRTIGEVDQPQPAHAAGSSPGARLRLAYLSPDLHEHPVGLLIQDLLEAHDRTRFEVSAYSVGSAADTSSARRRIVAAVDHFIDARTMSDAELATHIRSSGIDLLVDLAGHTHGNRMRALAGRPARVLVSYLGYSGTTGAAFYDYVLADSFVVPMAQQANYVERIVHLPECYMANARTRQAADEIPSRDRCGLPPEGFVFCCFNSTYKITPKIFDVWMRLLLAVPASVLWLKGDNPVAIQNLRRQAAARVVDPSRLVFSGNVSHAEHLARHRNADLFLDTFPYNAASTAGDALWMGLPLLTLAGESFVARVAGSLLRAAGLPELITTDLSSYEATARELANNPDKLAALKQRLLVTRDTSPLFDIKRFARGFETALLGIWHRHHRL